MNTIVKLLFIALSTLLLNSSCQKSDIEPMQWDDKGLITLGKKLEKIDDSRYNKYEIESVRMRFLPHLIQPNMGFVINF